MRVTVLGYTFKRDADDTRDSLAAKLIRYVLRASPREVRVHDPFITEDQVEERGDVRFSTDLAASIDGADVIFVATNHSPYDGAKELVARSLAPGGCLVDVWNAIGTGLVLVTKEQLGG